MPNEGIKASLKQRGVRLTRQRQILLELIDKSGQHLDAERLYQLAQGAGSEAEPRHRLPHAQDAQGRAGWWTSST